MVTLAAVSLVGVSFVGAPAQAADDPYQARFKTRTTVTVPAQVRPGTQLATHVVVRPNGVVETGAKAGQAAAAARPTGVIRLTYTREGGGFRVAMTKAYSGAPIRFSGPALTKLGSYDVRAVFVPDTDTVFRSSSDTDASLTRRGASSDDDDNEVPGPNPGVDSPGGLLPDTGGPDVGWLLLGLTLFGSGLGLVVAARERRSPYLV
ncbi:MAG TPA: hypothetical protein VFO49_10770 [Nocardioides sp.]|nr:hypothetical protein [Nocardioides sp.]